MNTPTVIVVTRPGDTHGNAVYLALLDRGVAVTRWFGGDLPLQQHASITYSVNASNAIDCVVAIQNADGSQNMVVSPETTLWLRRIGWPTPVRNSAIHSADQQFVDAESKAFFENLLYLSSNLSFSVNSYQSKLLAGSKAYQLKIAEASHLKVAPTLISNDPQEIKSFLAHKGQFDVIYKPFRVHEWSKDEIKYLTHTNGVTLKDLPSDLVLSASPGIYQKRLEKIVEIRATFFGSYCVAARLAPENIASVIDWRSHAPESLHIERIDLPLPVYEGCLRVMKTLGLNFGCFDFIVTKEGEYYFLEVNESGQFLWIERANPDIPMLDIMCDYLLARQFNFDYQTKKNPVSYHALRSRGALSQLVAEDYKLHNSEDASKYSYPDF